MSKVNSSEFSVVDVRVTAIVVITVPSPVAVTALSLDYECVICVFVMGDNRNHSLDSRSSVIGFIDTRYILGVAEFRLIPVGDWKIDSNGK